MFNALDALDEEGGQQQRVNRLLLSERGNLRDTLAEAIPHTTSISKQKYGVCPEIQLEMTPLHEGVSPEPWGVVIGSYVHYIAIELLENAVRATVDRFGVLDCEDAPPISVTVSLTPSEIGFCVADAGGGMSIADRHQVFAYFRTSAPKVLEQSGYQYSRSFGDAVAGYGLGLPMSRQYARHLGGDVQLSSLAGHGSWAAVSFCRHNLSSVVPLLQLDDAS